MNAWKAWIANLSLMVSACSRSGDPAPSPAHDPPVTATSSAPASRAGERDVGATAATQGVPPAATTVTATAAASSGALAGCGTHGAGAVWRLKGTIGGKPAQGDAIRIHRTIYLAVGSEGDFGPVLTGPIDAQGAFDVRASGGAITAIKGQLDARGKLTASAQRQGKAAAVVMTGTQERAGARPRLVSGYSAIASTDGAPSTERPVVEATTNFAIVLLGASAGEVSLVTRDSGTQGGACEPGRVRTELEAGGPDRAALLAAATALVPGATVVTSELFDEGCSRAVRSLRAVMLVDRQGQREVVMARIPSDGRATAEELSRQPYPPASCP